MAQQHGIKADACHSYAEFRRVVYLPEEQAAAVILSDALKAATVCRELEERHGGPCSAGSMNIGLAAPLRTLLFQAGAARREGPSWRRWNRPTTNRSASVPRQTAR